MLKKIVLGLVVGYSCTCLPATVVACETHIPVFRAGRSKVDFVTGYKFRKPNDCFAQARCRAYDYIINEKVKPLATEVMENVTIKAEKGLYNIVNRQDLKNIIYAVLKKKGLCTPEDALYFGQANEKKIDDGKFPQGSVCAGYKGDIFINDTQLSWALEQLKQEK